MFHLLTWDRMRSVSTLAKYLQISYLALGVWGTAYQMGSLDALGNPDQRERAMLEDICQKASATPGAASNARMITDGQLKKRSSLTQKDPQLYRVAKVGQNVVYAAKSLLGDTTTSAASAIEGEWTYILLNSPDPNAFVTALPRKIFVTTAMMDKFIDNDDEMALVLGHETSHLLLGHPKKRMIGKMILDTLEMIILTAIEAFGGMATGLAVDHLSTLKYWVFNVHSRESERAADEMGIKLAAMARYDTKKGIQVFEKLAKMESPAMALFTVARGHPPIKDRHRVFVEASKVEHVTRYENSSTEDLKRCLVEAMKDRHW